MRQTGRQFLFTARDHEIDEQADLTVEETNRLFETLQDWNDQLSHFDLDDLRCDDEDFAP